MSEETAEKHFEATPAQRERAKSRGNAPRSHEISGLVAFAGGLAGLGFTMPLLASGMRNAVAAGSSDPLHADVVRPAAVAVCALIPGGCAALAACFASIAQTGGLRAAAVSFSLGKLAPLPGLKRMFGAEAAVGGFRAVVAFVAVGAAVASIAVRDVAAASAAHAVDAIAAIVGGAMVQACWVAAAAGGLFAAADYAVARRRWLQSLKMTFEELKRDAKEQDGDPHAKSRRKHLHRALVRSGVARTREASFLIVNPTHIAIAIRYAPPTVDVPQILVRAAGATALEARAIAERAKIPVFEDVALARMLWSAGEAGRPIPPESFVAVAMVIAALIRAGILAT